MIILDTNVVSEPLKARPDHHVLEWLDRQAPATLFLTAISVAELWAGIELLPSGKRRSQLQDAMHTQILPLFESRLLGFDADDALAFASIYAKAKLAGHAIDFADCAIAAITSMRRFMLATRNQKDFKGTGIQLINPWRPEQ